MYTCIICHTSTEADDALVPTQTGKCICIRCYHRETESALPMPKTLRNDAIEAANRGQ